MSCASLEAFSAASAVAKVVTFVRNAVASAVLVAISVDREAVKAVISLANAAIRVVLVAISTASAPQQVWRAADSAAKAARSKARQNAGWHRKKEERRRRRRRGGKGGGTRPERGQYSK